MRMPLASFSDHRNSQTSGPSRRAFEVRLPCCVAILPAGSGGTGKIFSDLSDDKHPLSAGKRLSQAKSAAQASECITLRRQRSPSEKGRELMVRATLPEPLEARPLLSVCP